MDTQYAAHRHSVRERPLGDRGGGGQGCGDDECRAAALEADGAVAQPRVAQADVALAQRLRDLERGETTRSHGKSSLRCWLRCSTFLPETRKLNSLQKSPNFAFEIYKNSFRDCIVTAVNCATK